MAGELEEFLRQAAQRRAQRAEQQQAAAIPVRPVQAKPVRVSERQSQFADLDEVEVVEAQLLPLSSQNSGNLSRRHLPSTAVDQADERMSSHVKSTFDHTVATLSKEAAPTGEIVAEVLETAPTSETASAVSRRVVETHYLIDMLRNPASIRAAFVASEIFKRKF